MTGRKPQTGSVGTLVEWSARYARTHTSGSNCVHPHDLCRRHRAGGRHPGAVDGGVLGNREPGVCLHEGVVLHARERSLRRSACFRRHVELGAGLGGDESRIVGVVTVAVADEDGLWLDVDDILDDERRAARRDLEARDVRVDHEDSAIHRDGARVVAEPGEDDLVLLERAGLRVDVLDSENLLAGLDHVGRRSLGHRGRDGEEGRSGDHIASKARLVHECLLVCLLEGVHPCGMRRTENREDEHDRRGKRPRLKCINRS